MQFIDEATITVTAGNGGNGAVAFRRETNAPLGGPSGGDGGRGGDVVLLADVNVNTLLEFRYRPKWAAPDGANGMGADCNGRGGEDLVIHVPVGTQVYALDGAATAPLIDTVAAPVAPAPLIDTATATDAVTPGAADAASPPVTPVLALLADLDTNGAPYVVAKGGRGGLGNMNFATPWDRAPRRAQPGERGEAHRLRLSLKLLADVGLLGFPNVGKSTFIAAVSRARPKIADYPFTTLVPNLGVVRVDDDRSFVIADVPGLIPGASHGAGLGIQFLKHIERTRVLLHLLAPDSDRVIDDDFATIMHEVEAFSPEIARRPIIVAVTKADLPEAREAHARLKPVFAARGIDLKLVSPVTGAGMREMVYALDAVLRAHRPAPP